MSNYKTVIFISLFMLAAILPANQKWNSKAYDKVEPISIKDYRAYMTGTLKEGDLFEISLKDAGLLTGHICPGTLSGYIMTKKALKMLHPKSTPVRGNFEIIASADNDLLEVAEYILSPKKVKVDKKLSDDSKVLVIIFKRVDNGKSVKATFFKNKLMKDKSKFKKLKELKSKIKAGNGSSEDIKKVSSLMLKKVKMIINGKMNHLYKYELMK